MEVAPAVPLRSSNNINIPPKKTIEGTYQKKSQLEHILLRSDTYIGSVEKHTQMLWVYEDGKMVHRQKTTGGRNGYGAKLANIFSTEFVIETSDSKRQRKYKQVATSSPMGEKSNPVITKCKEGGNWTKVSFKPDLGKFSMTHLEDDVVALMKKRVVDMAGCLGKTVKV
ncbi:hypothetical protein MLD38_025925 [Melastoma candidum]|uniref:Uncharacterized protein n=1 Tax=Melastoma candidum TaxID=119954 RepID=A0ACB9NXD7_9MYRT|nr:hypothetical protein MLD38_025925 [Melastoma candidum]